MSIRIAIIGYGKIARDQHAPAIAADPRFELVAVASEQRDAATDLPWFATASQLLESLAGRLDAVAICTPPQVRYAIAREAIAARIPVLLEKPPAMTLGEIDDLQRQAELARCTVFTAWHSQHAAAVPEAARLLAGEAIARLDISWFEDVRKWHPGQEWIWSPGGFGVFDPGINALSIASSILEQPLLVRDAHLFVPANRAAPIAASLTFAGERMKAEFDWRHMDTERWMIRVETASGRVVTLEDGGAQLVVDGTRLPAVCGSEYGAIYDSFANLVASGGIAIDREPLRIVADAFLIGQRTQVEAFS